MSEVPDTSYTSCSASYFSGSWNLNSPVGGWANLIPWKERYLVPSSVSLTEPS